MNEVFEKKIKKLIKNYSIEEWKIELENNHDFLEFVKSYKDKNYNNVYHLLLKSKISTNDTIYKINDIIKFLISKNIPVLCVNLDNKLPSDLAQDKSIVITRQLKEQIQKEHLLSS